MAEDIAVALAAIRDRLALAGSPGGVIARLDAAEEFTRRDAPRLLAAVEAALAFHEPQVTANGIPACPWCSREAGVMVRSPCPEVRALATALTRGEGQ